jgi:uncharacterized protein YndB with AHSA1/START domain
MFSKFLKVGGIALALVLAVLAVVVAWQPDTYQLERSTTIDAPAERVFAQVNDFKAWDRWTPWKKDDSNLKTKFPDPSFGEGATFSWSGDAEAGEGTLTILESKPGELVQLEQEFRRPVAGKCQMAFVLDPEGDKTRLTWKMSGDKNFIAKAVCLVMDLEKTLGPQLEKGLAAIKVAAEESAAESVADSPMDP